MGLVLVPYDFLFCCFFLLLPKIEEIKLYKVKALLWINLGSEWFSLIVSQMISDMVFYLTKGIVVNYEIQKINTTFFIVNNALLF